MGMEAVTRADWQCKLIIIGDTGVGKTSVMRRFTEDQFSYNFVATVGIDFKIRMMQVRDRLVKVQIWDTAGQERFRSITTAYYRGAKGVLIVYDITSEKSFANVTKWVTSFRRWAGDNVECILIGNKCDMEDDRQVEKKAAEKLAKQNGMFFSETSAKDNVNVDHTFMSILNRIVDKHVASLPRQQEKKTDDSNIKLNSDETDLSAKFHCCKQ